MDGEERTWTEAAGQMAKNKQGGSLAAAQQVPQRHLGVGMAKM